MIEVYGNLWDFKAEAIVVTTNGYVKTNGDAVMGRGCAKELTTKLKGVESKLGLLLEKHGNHVFWLGMVDDKDVLSFPVKHRWDERAYADLIVQSIDELVTVVTALDFNSVVMPRPGCGNGGLQWEGHVKELIMDELDDRFHVIHYTRS